MIAGKAWTRFLIGWQIVYGFHLRAWAAFAVMAILCSPANEVRATTPSAIYKIGTAAALGDFAVTLNKAVIVPASEKSGQGAILDIQYTVQNISPAAVPLAHFLALHLEDRNGGVHDAMLAGATGSTPILAPGGQVTLSARFQIPKGTADPLAFLLRLGGDQGPRITLR